MNINNFKKLKIRTRQNSEHKSYNSESFTIKEIKDNIILKVDTDGGYGTLKYISDTKLNVNGYKCYITEIIGIVY